MPDHDARGAAALLDPEGTFPVRLEADRRTLERLADDLWRLPAGDRNRRLARIAALAHRLGGAAGTFGYSDVGDAALDLEDRVLAGMVDGDERRAAIEEGLTRLAAALAAALQAAKET